MSAYLSVRGRLFAFCIGLLLLLGTSNFLLGYLIQQGPDFQAQQQEQYRRFEVIAAVQEAMGAYRAKHSTINGALISGNESLAEQRKADLPPLKQEFDRALAKLESFSPARVEQVRAEFVQMEEVTPRVQQALLKRNKDGMELEGQRLIQHFKNIEVTLAAANQQERERAEEVQENARQQAEFGLYWSRAIIVSAALIGLLMALVVVQSIIRPLQATTTAIRSVNAGETEIDLPPDSRDEFGDMALALRQFRDQAERLRQLAYNDPLTGLGNRARSEEDLRQAIDRARVGDDQILALIYLDLDNFRSINDSLGHTAGDQYLCEAAARLRRFIPPDAELCRHSGDKFTVLIENLMGDEIPPRSLRQAVDIVLRGLSEPFQFQGHLLNMSVSAGIALYPRDGQTGEQLLSSADAAMYQAKKAGRNSARYASARITGDLRKQLTIAGEIRKGLERGEFEPFFQPVVDTRLRRVVGAEALLRWRHPERGLVLPGEFIGPAEETGMINALGERCLLKAHQHAMQWNSGSRSMQVAVNLSARQIHDGSILPLLRDIHARHPKNGFMEFELTESALLEHSEHSRQALQEIKGMGHRLGLDDFGTGYSSMSYLQRLPIDKIKIDHSFVAKMESSRPAQAIVSATLALAKSLDLAVVAEGVETASQSQFLDGMGCHLQQGFFYSKAIPVPEFDRWMQNYEAST